MQGRKVLPQADIGLSRPARPSFFECSLRLGALRDVEALAIRSKHVASTIMVVLALEIVQHIWVGQWISRH